jgi:antitoxin component YwqK of YwqJK toxin-antitoxin module
MSSTITFKTFDNPQKFAKVSRIREDGSKEEYYTRDGKPHGTYKIWWPSGTLRKEFTCVFGLLQGPIRSWHENGVLAVDGYYIFDKLHGKYSIWSDTKTLLVEKHYYMGVLHGKYTEWHHYPETGIRVEYVYSDGLAEGLYRHWYPDNYGKQLYCEFTYSKGKVHGKYTSWSPTGHVYAKCEYDDGKLKGLVEARN